MIFNTCITGKRVGKMDVGRYFNKLVNKEDYPRSQKDDLIAFANSLTCEDAKK